MKVKVLWVTASLNHYKARFLNQLAKDGEIELTVLTGSGREKMGDSKIDFNWSFNHIQLNVSKNKFGHSKLIRDALMDYTDFDWILIPAEKKNLVLFFSALNLRRIKSTIRLFSYNHPILRSNKGRITFFDKWLTKFFYRKLDRVVFYTEQSKNSAIAQGLISPEKAYYANNTLDNTEIEKHYQFALPNPNNFNILFIGRLIPNKRLPMLLDYFQELKHLCTTKKITLDIIGDGPEAAFVKQAAEKDTAIGWHGTLVDESDIAPLMSKANVVFIPGHSGLSINHAFLYGRPYITIQSETHAPEIHYLESGKNGLLLSGNKAQDLKTFVELIDDPEKVNAMAQAAYATGQTLSVQNWVLQMKKSLTDV